METQNTIKSYKIVKEIIQLMRKDAKGKQIQENSNL